MTYGIRKRIDPKDYRGFPNYAIFGIFHKSSGWTGRLTRTKGRFGRALQWTRREPDGPKIERGRPGTPFTVSGVSPEAHPGFQGGNTNAAFAVIRSTLRMDYGHPLLKPPI